MEARFFHVCPFFRLQDLPKKLTQIDKIGPFQRVISFALQQLKLLPNMEKTSDLDDLKRTSDIIFERGTSKF